MPTFTLELTTEEVKSLQGVLEDYLCDYHSTNEIIRTLLTKVTLVQLVDDGCMSKYEAAYVRDANYPPPDENGPAY